MYEWRKISEAEQNFNIVSGAWVFTGTRVPVSALLENLRDGATVEQFLEWFPGVTKAQVDAVLNFREER